MPPDRTKNMLLAQREVEKLMRDDVPYERRSEALRMLQQSTVAWDRANMVRVLEHEREIADTMESAIRTTYLEEA